MTSRSIICLAIGAIVQEILEHSLSLNFRNIVYERKSSNFEAHNIAKHALTLQVGCHVSLGQPGNLFFVPVNIVTG